MTVVMALGARRRKDSTVLFDWNDSDNLSPRLLLLDETLRDGLQGPSVVMPSCAQKIEMLERLAALGVSHVNIGYPGAGPQAYVDSAALAEAAATEGLDVGLACAARTHHADIEPIVRIAQRADVPIEVMAFIGASAVRCKVEGWTTDVLQERVRNAVRMAREAGLPCTLVIEDSTRTAPDVLASLWRVAAEQDVSGFCLCDTVGHVTPGGARRLVRFALEQIDELGGGIRLDWHGHNDRGLALINSLAAADAGADRVHGCLLGIGERVGNAPLDLLLLNQRLDGWDVDLRALNELVTFASNALGKPIPRDYPAFGRDAFRTATGVHAAAIDKARRRGEAELVDAVYSGVPAAWLGRSQHIEVGPMSGASNVRSWLAARGLEINDERVAKLLGEAKRASRVLSDRELLAALGDDPELRAG